MDNIVPSQIKEMQDELNRVYDEYNAKKQKIMPKQIESSKLLEKAYSINIIPRRYRNLKSIYYIHEFMSTSQLSLEDALLHGLIDDGISRLETKLDEIIAQNEDLIFQNRQLEANTSEIIEQNKRLLDSNQQLLESQERTEQSTYEAAQNARIAANYAETSAFFETLNYLK